MMLIQRHNELKEALARITIIEKKSHGKKIHLGSTFTLSINGNKPEQYQLVSTAIDINQISLNSPLGRAVFGRKEGEKVSCSVEHREIKAKIINIA